MCKLHYLICNCQQTAIQTHLAYIWYESSYWYQLTARSDLYCVSESYIIYYIEFIDEL